MLFKTIYSSDIMSNLIKELEVKSLIGIRKISQNAILKLCTISTCTLGMQRLFNIATAMIIINDLYTTKVKGHGSPIMSNKRLTLTLSQAVCFFLRPWTQCLGRWENPNLHPSTAPATQQLLLESPAAMISFIIQSLKVNRDSINTCMIINRQYNWHVYDVFNGKHH